jgi:hypothetical protein
MRAVKSGLNIRQSFFPLISPMHRCSRERENAERIRVPPQKALDLFRPAYNTSLDPIPAAQQETYTARINITFRFYRSDFHPAPGLAWKGPRLGTPYCKCGIPTYVCYSVFGLEERALCEQGQLGYAGDKADDVVLVLQLRGYRIEFKRDEKDMARRRG